MRSYLQRQVVTNPRILLYLCHRGSGVGKALDDFASLLPQQRLAGHASFNDPRSRLNAAMEMEIRAFCETILEAEAQD